MRIYRLKFLSALHVDSKGSGNPEVSDDFIRSDTLSAALALSWATLYPEEKKPDFFLNPPFTVSSAFPYIGEILLFPTPVWRIWKKVEVEKRKELKGIRWISQDLMEKILDRKTLDHETIGKLPHGVAISAQDLRRNPHLAGYEGWAGGERQRVHVDRLGIPHDGGLFFFALQFFAPDSGLYLIANMDSSLYPKFRSVLAFLGDTGIGADRSSGLGHFFIRDEREFNIAYPQDADGAVTLSLFNPGPEDRMDQLSSSMAYGLITRSGWISGSTIGRPPIRAFTEGSYFSGKPKGRVVEMLPESLRDRLKLPLGHSAPRDFRALFLPCHQPPFLTEETP